jgi:hypothetical protein
MSYIQPIDRPEWLAGQRSHEIERLERILRHPGATEGERAVAQDMLEYWMRQRESGEQGGELQGAGETGIYAPEKG